MVVVFAWRLCGLQPQQISRDDPLAIKQRIASVAIACVVSLGSLYALTSTTERNDDSFLEFAGLYVDIKAIISCVALVCILFLGPLAEMAFDRRGISAATSPWMNLRTYLVAPLAEEIVFRGCIGKALLAQGCTLSTIVWLGPAMFSLAHLRDIAQTVRNCRKAKKIILNEIVRLIVPMFFRQLFGMLCMFLFLRTRCLLTVICAHIFCNYMGFPSFKFIRFRDSTDRILAACTMTGVVVFFLLLWPLTERSENSAAIV